MMQLCSYKKECRQKGSALVYILIAIALMAAVTATFMEGSGQQQTAQNASKLAVELKSQIDLIRSAINECVLSYPNGDTTMPAAPATVGGERPVRIYPLQPRNTYMPAPYPTYGTVDAIRCPGNPGNSNNHAKIFGAASGKFLPQPPPLMSNWFYYNNTDGVFILIVSSKTDAYVATALQKLDGMFAKCESQYIEASGSDVHTTSHSDNGYTCPSGNKCFLVRFITNPSAIFPGENPACP